MKKFISCIMLIIIVFSAVSIKVFYCWGFLCPLGL